jgi:hypothetical protein
MDSKKLTLLCALVLIPFQVLDASSPKGPIAAATISHRVSKPGQSLELLITVRKAESPVSALPDCPTGLEMRRLRNPQHLVTEGEDVWLLRFRVIPKAVGNYEIPPIHVSDRTASVFTKPLIFHVSSDPKPPLPDPKELALTTDIPLSLAQEAIKNCPAPAPKPTPSPAPRDQRPLPARVISSIGHGLTWIWNYPGK